MMDWTTHPGMNNLDPLKREIIRTAAKQVQGKSGNQMATVMMALITSARKYKLFTGRNVIDLRNTKRRKKS